MPSVSVQSLMSEFCIYPPVKYDTCATANASNFTNYLAVDINKPPTLMFLTSRP